MELNLTNGAIGHVQGPFTNNTIFNFQNKEIKLGISIAEKDLMTFETSEDLGFIFQIDNEYIKLGKEGIYESDDWIRLNQLSFPNGAPSSVLIEYVVKFE